MINEVEVHFQKIKYKHLGEQGIVNLKYSYSTGRFFSDKIDFDNWLIPKKNKTNEIEFEDEFDERKEQVPF